MNLNVLRAVELLLSVFLSVTVFIGDFNDDIGLTLPNGFTYMPIIVSVVIILLFALEFFNAKPWVRLVYLIIALIVCFMMADSIEMLNMTIWLCGFIYMVMVLVSFIRTRPSLAKETAKLAHAGCLPVGILRKRDLVFTYVFFGVLAAITILDCVLSGMYSVNLWYTVPAIMAVFIVVGVFFAVKFNSLWKLLSHVNKEMNFGKFDAELQNILGGNLHPETQNYLTILRANYLFAYDKAEGIAQFEKTERPEAKQYKETYDLIEIIYFINKEDYEAANEALKNYKALYQKSKNNVMLERALKLYATDDEIINIEGFLPVNGKLPFANLSNMYELMYYYDKRGRADKAAEYAKMILDMNTDFKQWNEEARKIIGG